MGIATLAFYFFGILAVGSGLFVVVARNPVHAVLWLILAFLSSAGLFILLGAEFVAMLLVIVYVGAVAVLFLFVVMMLDVNFAEFRAGMAKFVPVGLLIGLVLLMLLGLVFGEWSPSAVAPSLRQAEAPDVETMQNTPALGNLIYTKYVYLFQAAGLILLVAMIGAIILTHRRREGIKRQDIVAQMQRDPANSIELKDVASGRGLQ
ncbi:MAG: NADH-quinone oxidoreductase subunit J [Albidovulum sp.]|nr:NADH-quinone oxidoreductase subunit J [Albidovulum sp.]MDE0531338.1 NADH-quinone oxidoreductase subunit J [Albidovulum sp.]